jgi:hypothetical protein
LLYHSCTIITTEASESIQDIHNRIPVILKTEVIKLTWSNLFIEFFNIMVYFVEILINDAMQKQLKMEIVL